MYDKENYDDVNDNINDDSKTSVKYFITVCVYLFIKKLIY